METFAVVTNSGNFLGYTEARNATEAVRLWNRKYPKGWPAISGGSVDLVGQKAAAAYWTDPSDGPGNGE